MLVVFDMLTRPRPNPTLQTRGYASPFTGTPLVAGEERTREVFGDYVSV